MNGSGSTRSAAELYTPPQPLAMASLVLSGLSLLGCISLVGLTLLLDQPSAMLIVFILPLLGGGGAICGFLAFRRIRNSANALGGRAPATLGLFVGLLTAIIQLAVITGALLTWLPLRQTLAPAVSELMTRAVAGDASAARRDLSPSAEQLVTDSRILAFVSELESQMGQWQKARAELDIIARSRAALTSAPAGSPARTGAPGPTETPRPVELVFDSGEVVAFVFLDDNAMKRDQQVRFEDMLIMLPQAQALTLQRNGPARRWAEFLGLRTIPLPETQSAGPESAGG